MNTQITFLTIVPYHKVRQLFLLQSATSVIKKGESYYKVRQNRRFKKRLEQNKKCIGYHRQVY